MKNSKYLENTKNFLFSNIFYIENNLNLKYSLNEYVDKYEACELLCSAILKMDPNTPLEMLQAAVVTNLKTSVPLESLIKIIDNLKIQITYTLNSSKIEFQEEPDFVK